MELINDMYYTYFTKLSIDAAQHNTEQNCEKKLLRLSKCGPIRGTLPVCSNV